LYVFQGVGVGTGVGAGVAAAAGSTRGVVPGCGLADGRTVGEGLGAIATGGDVASADGDAGAEGDDDDVGVPSAQALTMIADTSTSVDIVVERRVSMAVLDSVAPGVCRPRDPHR
jgi:hypothetical protein